MECLQNRRNRNFCLLSFWRTVSEKFPDERSCLAYFLAYHSAEVLSGVKPGNLVNIPDRRHPCGKNPFILWRRHGQALLADSDISVKVLEERRNGLLIYIYCPEALNNLLMEPRIRNFLEKAGYVDLSSGDSVLAELKRRMGQGGFPHEIGLFLGDPRKSLALAALHRDCRCRMAERLRRDDNPSYLLRRNFSHPAAAFFVWRQAI